MQNRETTVKQLQLLKLKQEVNFKKMNFMDPSRKSDFIIQNDKAEIKTLHCKAYGVFFTASQGL